VAALTGKDIHVVKKSLARMYVRMHACQPSCCLYIMQIKKTERVYSLFLFLKMHLSSPLLRDVHLLLFTIESLELDEKRKKSKEYERFCMYKK
jgi:hypothetical protein